MLDYIDLRDFLEKKKLKKYLMKQNNLKWEKEYWFPKTKCNHLFRKIKIARLFGMDLDSANITHTYWSYMGHPNRKVYKIPVGDKKDSSYKQFIKKYLGTWLK